MSVRLFVGNLSYEVSEADLRSVFGEVGAVTLVRIPLDRETGRPRGFAFVDFAEREPGEEAIRRLHQFVLKGRPLAVSEAVAREDAGARAPMSSAGPRPPASSSAPAGGAPRTFGPDALPRNRRRPEQNRGGPKGPIKERGGGRSVGVGFADDDTAGADEVPFWAVDDGKAGDDE